MNSYGEIMELLPFYGKLSIIMVEWACIFPYSVSEVVVMGIFHIYLVPVLYIQGRFSPSTQKYSFLRLVCGHLKQELYLRP